MLLGVPYMSAQELICKVVFCQQLLHFVTLQSSTNQAWNGSSCGDFSGRLARLVWDLIQLGADPFGWPQQRAVDMCAAWNDIVDQNSRYVDCRRRKQVPIPVIAGCQEIPSCGKPLDICQFMDLNLCNYSTYHLPDAELLVSGQQWTSHYPHFHTTRKSMVAAKCLPPLIARLVNVCRTATSAHVDPTLRLLFRICGPAMGLANLDAIPLVGGDMHDGPVCAASASCQRHLTQEQQLPRHRTLR